MNGNDENFYRHVGNNSVAMLDPYGLLSFSENYAQRSQFLGGSGAPNAAKAATGLAVGGSISQAAGTSTLFQSVSAAVADSNFGRAVATALSGTALEGTAARFGFGLAGSAATTSIGAAAATGAVQSAAVTGAFYGGLQLGTALGALGDTIVDDQQGGLNSSPVLQGIAGVLGGLGFGSGQANHTCP